MNKYIIFKKIKAFTLLETMVATSLLVVAIIGPVSVMLSSVTYANLSKENLTAKYLAEEAIELLQNRVDTLYVFCLKNSDEPICIPSAGETYPQVSWRIFKDGLGTTTGMTSCINLTNISNPDGCTFDYEGMLKSATMTPTLYSGDVASPIVLIATTTPGGSYQAEVMTPLYLLQDTVVDLSRTQEIVPGSSRYSIVTTMEHSPSITESQSIPLGLQRYDDFITTVRISYVDKRGRTQTYSIKKMISSR